MKAYIKQLKFPSTSTTYFKDITAEVREAVKTTKATAGFVLVTTKHTTLGVVVQEIAEPNLLKDIIKHTLHHVPEDRRCTKVKEDYPHPTSDYLHRCQDNPFCNEIDEDYNAASHIRALIYSHPSVVLPIRDSEIEMGKYQQVALFEFDGRDGTGKNPIRQRTVQIWIYPADEIEEI